MALTKDARNKLYAFVQAVKRLLIADVESQLQQYYGIRPDGTILPLEQLTTRETDRLYRARLLRDRLTYLYSNIVTVKDREKNAVQQLVREQAFTVLNRFAALRMAEERTIITETVRQGFNSEGFQVFDSVTGQGISADQFTRYSWYLVAVFDELALDLPAVFDRYSPYALLFPTEPTLLKLFELLNAEDIKAFRQVGRPALNLWREDETIGWMYQYYNADDERKQMRETQAPRNSRELAVRNQFFTPRYVVQFLTDNTLGRIWFDMTGGQTELADRCKFMVKESLVEATEPPNPKDPRHIRMLDPACGSMHFGLYAFDLFEVIYREAWDKYPNLMGDLRDLMTRAEFLRQVPALILAHNIHGVEIDPRALQMAGLSLWLRAQRSFAEMNLAPADRPAIKRGNLVLAEAMPGNPQLLSEAVKGLSKPMRRLVLHLWEQMQLAGETGVVLRIEHEIRQEISRIERDWNTLAKTNQGDLFDTDAQAEAEQIGNLNDREQREQFFEKAEHEVVEQLRRLAESSTTEDAYQKLLFADDTARGFAFIELCRQRYDVVVMNPPFGATSIATKLYVDRTYQNSSRDLAAVFVERMHEMLSDNGLIGAISTRTIFFLGWYEEWRQKFIVHNTNLKYFVDLGMGVLDAMVETAAYVLSQKNEEQSISFRIAKPKVEQKEYALFNSISEGKNKYILNTSRLSSITNSPLSYWVTDKDLKLFEKSNKFENLIQTARQGPSSPGNFRFLRNNWELATRIGWPSFLAGETSSRFNLDYRLHINWINSGKELDAENLQRGQSVPSRGYLLKKGLSWAYRTATFEPHIVLEGAIFSHKRALANFKQDVLSNHSALLTCSLWNSYYFDYLLKLSMERVEHPTFINGIVNKSPYPTLPYELQTYLAAQTVLNHGLIQAVFEREETSLYFARPALAPSQSLAESIGAVLDQFAQNKVAHLASLAQINEQVYGHFGIDTEEQAHIREIINNEDARPEGTVFNVSERELAEGVFSWLIGVAFGRWDVTLAHHPERIPVREDIFAPLPDQSPASLHMEGLLEHPVPLRMDGLAVVEDGAPADLMRCIRATLRYLYHEQADAIERELAALLGVDDLADYLNQPNRFFAAHLAQYTQNKRTAPIYWPLSVPSGHYTVWVYYPKLHDQTLYRIVGGYVKPKQAALTDDIRRLEAAETPTDKDRRLLADWRSLRGELAQMEADLLSIADLPYHPNHDDGVLLTAAPLHGFFRNRKWQQATEAAWQELQRGDYDWAHLTLPIWPDRVKDKCKSDLSMAIAHGLEDTCSVKLKEKKERTPKAASSKTKGKKKSTTDQTTILP
ncbi:BREX-1 system adenine-specific DNA-methyltransferase PglX [Dyadobacter chenhuakuii]|uniref:site-specific DNA-methyltransferase (adenine-specific) n=1 Tax=Dyadobacter chenhuakuii TaxID=2909339 RepID=A0ABY4XLV0_9BACT|nr:BREX-1 system adenine-specific DNA-methyltransferase PglX [Dyadobacter chenhuakuii]MCF2494277.1 BREX-1 system adenine-specific DNA-methyltransferase PglX [Dyadobacter chenhuakuii]USJ31402.1 BREX-1 system adenine-specific DNA-methyltransferase PglX [Dyadobacter chenhuakuii]